jgi:Deoxyribodipyrimidine photolyase
VIQHHNEQVFTFDGFTLVDNANLPFELHKIPQVFTAFKNKIEKYGAFNKCVALPNLPTNALTFAQKGGENYGLSRLKYYLQDTDLIANYKQTRNGMLGTDYSSRFSPWLALGNLSARTIAYYIYQYEKDVNANESTYWLIFELLWRDFFSVEFKSTSK